MTPRKCRPFRNDVLNNPRDPYPAPTTTKAAVTMLDRLRYGQRNWYLDKRDDQIMLAALLDEFGIIVPTNATADDLTRLVISMASDSRPIPFGRRQKNGPPVKDLLPLMERLADFIEAHCDHDDEPNELAACRHFKKENADKRSPKYLHGLYTDYRHRVKRPGANQRARDRYFDRLSDSAAWSLTHSPAEAYMEPDRFLNKTQTAQFFGVSVKSINNWLTANRLPAPEILPNGRPYWRISTLRGCIKSAAPGALAAVA